MIRLMADQIPAVWEAIKFGVVQSTVIPDGSQEKYLNKLLYELLSNKAQCFVKLNGERQLQYLVVTKLLIDQASAERAVFINSQYAFLPMNLGMLKDAFEDVKKFAESEDCKVIYGWTMDPRMEALAKRLGFQERFKSYAFTLGG